MRPLHPPTARRRPRSLLALGLAAALVAACSPGGLSPSPGSPSPVSTPGPPATTPSRSPVDAAAIGRAFVEALARGDLASAEALEDETMRAQAPAATLGALWLQLEGQLGTFVGIESVRLADQPPYRLALLRSRFARTTVDLQVTVDQAGRVAGFFVRSLPEEPPGPSGGPSPTPEAPAGYVRQDAFVEAPVTVGAEPWTLPGTLAMPVGQGPFPAVVLVAGSGPQDRDETIGPNKPLRDLAWGLASQGIAVLRYDKRTLVHAAELVARVSTVTVNEETVDDAVAAVALLRSTPGVDPDRVFLAGHSLGGYLAPRIAGRAAGLRGLVLLEANSRPLPELILEQVQYLAALDGTPGPDVQAQIDAVGKQVALALSPTLSPTTPAAELPLGVPAAYWLDLQRYDPRAAAAALELPMLFVQGGRDYQVTAADLDGWRQTLGGRDTVDFREYPALDHLLLAGSGPSRPEEYQQPGHVAAEVVTDVAAWILAR